MLCLLLENVHLGVHEKISTYSEMVRKEIGKIKEQDVTKYESQIMHMQGFLE